jgi:hypothetical protein
LRYKPLPTVGLFLAILFILSTAACRAMANASPPTVSHFVSGVVTRSAYLNYITEQDSEVFAFYRNTPVKELTDEVFLGLLMRPKESKIVRQPWPVFFQLRTQGDPTGRWRQLQDYLEANLTNLTVLRLPRDPPYDSQYDLYAVGIFNGGVVVGVQMFGVAT